MSAPATLAAGPDSIVIDRPPPHFVDVHDAAVAAHDHQRRDDAGLAHAGFGHVGGRDHARQDRGIDHGGARAGRQPVQARDLVAARGEQAGLGAQLAHQLLAAGVVDAEGADATSTWAPSATSSAMASRTSASVHAFRDQEPVGGGSTRPGPELDWRYADLPSPARSAASRPPCPVCPRGPRRLRAARWSPASCCGRGTPRSPAATPASAEHLAEHLDHALGDPAGMACVVSTECRPTTSRVALSISTALVNVPPTSMPMR